MLRALLATPPRSRRHPLAFVLAAVVIGVTSAGTVGCGKTGPPVAPERRLPVAVSDLSAVIEENALVLTWTNPGVRVDGSRLKDLTMIRIYRREETGDGEPKAAMLSWGKVVGYDEIKAIRLADPAPAKVEASRVTWTDPAKLTLGRRYVYVVTAVDSIGRLSAPSSRLVVTFLAAPRPPVGLTARAGEGQVRLEWSPPALLVDGSAVTGPLSYELLRGASADGPFGAVTPGSISSPGFTDRGLANEQTYYYAVRAVRSEAGLRALSDRSTVVAATPVKLTPPPPPTNLVAVPSAGAVRLVWDASPESDVAGYVVYRAVAPGADWVRLTPTLITRTTYSDQTVERGKTYSYVVTAVDRARRPNESARSAPARATAP
ncbi:MAG: fibronectin type III domain-containing protein [Candidatus Rokuibacteriota bacterium]